MLWPKALAARLLPGPSFARATDRPGPRGRMKASLCILLAVLCYAAIDAITKGLTAHYAVAQILLLRGSFSLLILVPALLRPQGLARLRSRYIGIHLLRGTIGVAALGLFVDAFRYMRLSDVVAIAYTAPLFVLLWGGLLFREALSWPTMGAVVLGLLGGAIILAPSLELLQWRALVPLSGALCLSLYIAMIKLAPAEDTIAAVFYVTLVGILVAAAFALWQWRAVPSGHWLLFVIIGVMSGLALYCRTIGYGRAPLAVTAPIEYSGILWAVLLGFLCFDEQPTAGFIPGSLLLLGSNLLLIAHPKT